MARAGRPAPRPGRRHLPVGRDRPDRERRGQRRGLLHGVADRGQNQVLQHLHVVRIDHGSIDGHFLELESSSHPDPDRAPAGRALNHLGSRRLLGLLQVLLHLAELRQKATQVELGLLAAGHGRTSSAPGNASIRRCSGDITPAGASSRSAMW